jgi:hypothetical protein
MISTLRTLAALAALSATATAQFTATGPFTGAYSEGFETQDTSSGPFPTCVVDRVFSGNGDLCSQVGGAHITTGWGFGCTMQERSGVRFLGSSGAGLVLTLDTPGTRFGGYFGTNNPSASDGLIQFYDAAGALLHSDAIIAPNNCTWTWNGWDFGGALVDRIEIYSNYGDGDHLMLDDLEVDLQGVATGSAYCFGDGTGALCPCAAFGGAGEGCLTTSGKGAALSGAGNASVGADSFVLSVSGGPANKPGIFFQGNNQLGGGNGNPAGDGLLCTSGGTIRYSVNPLDAGGATSQGGFGVNAAPGVTRNYQYWFRDTGNACGGGFNFTNGWSQPWN